MALLDRLPFPLPFRARAPRVALVRLQGVIAARGGGPPFGGPALSAAGLAPVLERAFALKGLAGVVLAINSPGGSPVQSSLIAAAIRRHAQEAGVPVVAVVEDAAASGGYWLACAADAIVADPSSIVGSIGVVSAGFGFPEALARLGVERRLRTAGTEKAFRDPFLPPDPADAARLDALLAALHAEFAGWVRARRGPRLRAPESELFTGRFWTGRRALELGLVDALGDAAGAVRERFGAEARLVPVGGPRRSLLGRLLPWGSAPGGAAGAGAWAEGAAGGVAAALEARAAWARLGL